MRQCNLQYFLQQFLIPLPAGHGRGLPARAAGRGVWDGRAMLGPLRPQDLGHGASSYQLEGSAASSPPSRASGALQLLGYRDWTASSYQLEGSPGLIGKWGLPLPFPKGG